MRQRQKSSDYPRKSLPQVIKKSRNIEDKYFSGEYDEDDIAQALDYKGVSGASIVYLAALRRFGLLSPGDIRGKFNLSNKLKRLLKPDKESAGYVEFIEEIAFTPDIFFEIRERFGKRLPAEEELNAFLSFKGYSLQALPLLTRAYRETFEYVACYSSNYVVPQESMPDLQRTDRGTKEQARASRLEVNLGNILRATVIFYGEVTQKSIERLIRFLDANKEDFPEGE